MSPQIDVCIVMAESGDDEETVSELAEAELNEDEPQRYIRLKIELSPPNDQEVSSRTFEIKLD